MQRAWAVLKRESGLPGPLSGVEQPHLKRVYGFGTNSWLQAARGGACVVTKGSFPLEFASDSK